MANFTINIKAEVITPYTANDITMNENVCGSIQKTVPLGVTESSGNPSIRFLLDNAITPDPWDTLILDDIVYSSQSDTRIEHNGTIINSSNTPYNIDISSVSPDQAIPGLNLIYNLIEGGAATNIASYTIKLETTTQTEYDTLEGNIIVKNGGCLQPPEPSVSSLMVSTKGECGDGEAQAFAISAQLNTSVKWTIEDINGGNHGYFLDIVQTDSIDGTNIRNIVRVGPSWNDRILIEDYSQTTQMFYRVSLCARPRLGTEPNEVEVRIHIRNTADTADVFTTTLRDDDI